MRAKEAFRPSLECLEDRTVPAQVAGTELLASSVGQPHTAQAPTPGMYDPESGIWYLRSATTDGAPDAGHFLFGGPGYTPVVGDWTNSGVTGVGAVSDGTWYLRSTASTGNPNVGDAFEYGLANWTALSGDWNGTGHTGIGTFDPTTATWYLRNDASSGEADAGVFEFGMPNWIPLVGDWTGSGHTGIGVYDPSTATFYLSNEANGKGEGVAVLQFGQPGWKPVVGDWDGDGKDSIGAVDNQGNWHLSNTNVSKQADLIFNFGLGSWTPIRGTWKAPNRPHVPGDGGQSLPIPSLTQDEVQEMASVAIARLSDQGADSATVARLGFVKYDLSNRLDGNAISSSDPETWTVHLSQDAAGHGWFVDATPRENEEFTVLVSGGKQAAPGSPAEGKIDLLSAVFRELSSLAGRQDDLTALAQSLRTV